MSLKTFGLFLTTVLLTLFLLSGCDTATAPIDVDAPTNLEIVIVSENRINLSWEYDKQTSGVKYIVSRKEGEDEWDDDYGEVTGKNFVDDIPTNSYTVYSYRVKAVSIEEDKESFFSEAAAFFSPLTKPTELNVTQLSQSELEIVWEDNAIGETGYRIDRKIGEENWVVSYKTLEANSTYLKDIFSEMFVGISYRVYPYVGTTAGPKAEISFMSAYTTPANTNAVQISPTEIQFSWDYSEEDEGIIDSFEIYRKRGASEWKHLATKSRTVREIVDVLDYESGTYSYRVRASSEEYSSSYSTPAEVNFNLFYLGELSLNNRGNRFLLHNEKLFIANDYNGVIVVDVSSSSNPNVQRTISLPGRIISLYYKENLLLAGNHSGKVFLIDMSDEANPLLIHTLETLNPVYDLAVVRINHIDHIVIANGIGGLLIASYNPNVATDPKIITRYNTHGLSQALLKEGTFVYLADGHNGLLKLDLSNPLALSVVAENSFLGNCLSLRRQDNRLYVSTGRMGMKIVDKNSLQQIIHYDTHGYAVDIQPSVRYAYIADIDKGLYIVNIVNDSDLYSQAFLPSQLNLTGIITQGSYAYLLSESNLQIIQILP